MLGWAAQLRRFASNETGATAIEYALVAGLVAVAAIAAMVATGGTIANLFSGVSGRSANVFDNTGL